MGWMVVRLSGNGVMIWGLGYGLRPGWGMGILLQVLRTINSPLSLIASWIMFF